MGLFLEEREENVKETYCCFDLMHFKIILYYSRWTIIYIYIWESEFVFVYSQYIRVLRISEGN